MEKAPIKEDEKGRLDALNKYCILDTPPEMNLDEITMIAAYICRTPISLISLIDANRQWFKAKVGLNASETGRDISFCGHAIYQDDIFIIENATADERFKDNPLVINKPNVIFYAGAPLVTPAGYKIGTLCVIANKPQRLDPEQINILRSLSKQVVFFFELSKQNRKIREDEMKLIYTSKMHSLGEMSAGVAHEINNPLTIISGKIQSLNRKAKTEQKIKNEYLSSELDKISFAVDRIDRIIKSLKQFSRSSNEDTFISISLAKIVNDNLLLCEEKFNKKKIKINIIDIKDIKIYCKPTQISQVIINLLLNSYDALEETKDKLIEIKLNVNEINNKIQLLFIDNGKGIPAHLHEKIMQPFFTTKEIGKGTGLGLSSSKGIIEEHGGQFFFDSNYQNTCFVIELPIGVLE